MMKLQQSVKTGLDNAAAKHAVAMVKHGRLTG
jgi:hypothetical protein